MGHGDMMLTADGTSSLQSDLNDFNGSRENLRL